MTLKGLKERVLPNADDEFAKDLGQFDTLDALKTDIRERLDEAGQRSLRKRRRRAARGRAREGEPHRRAAVARPAPDARDGTGNPESRAAPRAAQVSGLGQELQDKVLADSELKVRAGLLMAEIAKKEAIQIGDDEIEQGLKELAEQTGKNVAKLRVEYRDQGKREMLDWHDSGEQGAGHHPGESQDRGRLVLKGPPDDPTPRNP